MKVNIKDPDFFTKKNNSLHAAALEALLDHNLTPMKLGDDNDEVLF